MAFYHFRAQIISRGSGRSAVAAAAYRSGDTLTNEWDGLTHDYSKKGWIQHTEILLPAHAPEIFQNRSVLWNAVETAETNGNAQLAREIVMALPQELSLEQQIALVREFVQQNFIKEGMCADITIHNPPVTDAHNCPVDEEGNRTYDKESMIFQNPHAHVMLTMRPLDANGNWLPKSQKHYLCRKENEELAIPSSMMQEAEKEGWKKQYQYRTGKRKVWMTAEEGKKKELVRVSPEPKSVKKQNTIMAKWNSKETLLAWRKNWADTSNHYLLENGINQRIDHRSYAEQGIDRLPTVHMGVEAFQMEKRGIHTELGNLNRQIKRDNEFLEKFQKQIEILERKETERLQAVSSKLEGLRARYIASAYQQLLFIAQIQDEEQKIEIQLQTAASTAKATEQIMLLLAALQKSVKQYEEEKKQLSPVQMKKRKALEEEILCKEQRIRELKQKLEELNQVGSAEESVSGQEVINSKKFAVESLRERQSKIYQEFYTLVNENKENMKQLREMIQGKRRDYEKRTEESLKEHYAEKFQKSLYAKAKSQAPDLIESSETEIKHTLSHRR